MMHADNWQIDLGNALFSFRIEPAGNTDLLLILASRSSGTAVASMTYSRFTPFSQSRPWDLKTPVFRKISVEKTFHGILAEAETENFRIRDFFIWEDSLLKIARSWELLQDMKNLVLGTRLPLKRHEQEKWTIPGIIYNDNPSADPGKLVPHLPGHEKGVLAVEEHRLPIPGINAEWKNAEGSFSGFTLFSVPSETPMKEYWSMGLQRTLEGFDLLSLSGAAAFDEKKDCIYGAQNKIYHVPDLGYMDLKQGTVLRKTLFIHFQDGFQEGQGFAALVEQGMKINDPQAHPVLSLEQMIELKTCSLSSHWKKTEHGSGFNWILEGKENGNVYNAKPGFLYGWVGQSFRLAWCAFQLAFSGKKEWFERGTAVLDHFASAPEAGNIPGLKYLFQDHNTGEWFNCELRNADGIYSRMTGECLANLADTLLLLKKHGTEIQEKWENALRRGIAFLREPGHWTDTGIFPLSFRLDGSPASQIITGSGTSCIEALIRAGEYFKDPEMLDSGFEMLDRYYELFLKTLRHPFSRATLDAACEDKESGLYFFLASYRAYCLTKSAKHEKYAEESALWISTFVYQWNTIMKAGSICADHGFESVFWPSVSVQNMHLDVFFPAWEFYDFGKQTGKEIFCRIGQGVMQAWSHGIARFPGDWDYALPGEQGEQFFHTNYYQGYFDERAWRGGANAWNPVWITALVLYAALHFKKTENSLVPANDKTITTGEKKMVNFYDHTLTSRTGETVKTADFKGKVVLIVNTATGCGFTPQYAPIEKMYLDYHDKGLEILDIPCNQFGGQAPGTDDEIHEFCTVHFNTTFPQMKKSEVNGENQLPLYAFLKSQQGFKGFGEGKMADILRGHLAKVNPGYEKNDDIKWNFTKFVIDRKGNVVARFEPPAEMTEVETLIRKLLAEAK